jgi:hypothetical protein
MGDDEMDLLVPRQDRMAVDFSVWAGVKLGAGLVIGGSLVTLIVWAILSIAVGMGITAWRL